MIRRPITLSVALLAMSILCLSPGQSVAEEPATQLTRRRSGVFGVVSQMTHRPRPTAHPSLAGGGPETSELIGLIQGTVEPDGWVPAAAAPAAPANASPAALQLVDVIQENVEPPTWDVNGGWGTIMIVPW